MPLVRVEVRNEYGLGAQELYGAADKDDPKALLEGVAVAGLVGILRQLGDLAEFAAEVFHDVQEQVMFTAARSHKMVVRVQHIEAALPPLEKAVMAQTSHIHFAYTAGSVWHPNTRAKCNHFIHSDLPRFILNTYEECCDPPRLHLLDKFDTGGPGACLRKYSDPSFFKKALAGSDMFNSEKILREKKASKIKKKGSRRRNGSISWNSGRKPFTSSNSFGQSSATESISTFHTRSRSEVIDQSLSFDMRTRPGYIECVFDVSSSKRYGVQEHNKLPTSKLKMQHSGIDCSVHNEEGRKCADENLTCGSLQGQNVLNSPSVTWDEKIEITEPNCQLADKIAEVESKSQFLPMTSDIKCVSGASLSMLHSDQEHSEFSTLSLKPQHDGVSESIENNEQRTDAIDNQTHVSLQEQNVPRFSAVTWDEKIEITEPNSEQPRNIREDENEAQLRPTNSDIEYVFGASPSMQRGDKEHKDLSASSLKMQHRGANDCIHHDDQKIGATDYLTHGSLQEQNFPNISSFSRDEFSTSSLNMQHIGDDGSIDHDEQKEGTIDNLAFDSLKEPTIPQFSSFNWVEKTDITEPNSQQADSIVNDRSEAQLLQSLELVELEKEAAMHGIFDMEDTIWVDEKIPDLPSEDDQSDEDEKIEITEPNSEQPRNIREDENEAQLLPTNSDIEYVFGASPSMQRGDKEHKDLSASSLKMQHRGANDCIHHDDQKIGATDYLTHGSLQEQNFPNISSFSRDEFSTSSLNMQHIGDDCFIDHDEQKEGTIDNLAFDSLKEPTIPQFSSFNWVEKTDITEPNSQQADSIVNDRSEAQLLQSLELVELEKEAAMHGIFDIEDSIWVDENIPDLPSEDDQSDEAGSETDKYLDALNTLESESETDTECQTKREVQHLSFKLKNKGMECETQKIHEDAQNSEATNVDLVTTITSSSNKFPNLVSSEVLVCAQPPHITSVFSDQDISVVNDLSGSTDHLDVSGVNVFDSVINVPSSSGSSIGDSQDLLDNELLTSFSVSQKPAAEIFGTSSIKFWTNGGLLGLEPSKPPDFSVPTNNSMAGDEDGANNHSSGSLMVKSHSNGYATELDMLVKTPGQMEKKSDGEEDGSLDIAYQNDLSGQLVRRAMNVKQAIDHSDSSTTYYDKQDDDMLKENCLQPSSAVTEGMLEKSEDSSQSSSYSNVHQNGLIESSLVTPLAELPSVYDIKNSHSEACQDNVKNSSSNFRHIVANDFAQNGSFHNGEYEPAKFMKSGLMKLNKHDCLEQKGKDGMEDKITAVRNPKEKLENASPVNSGASSPPLEPMKISFHPIDDFATSKLKLKFPGGHHFHESIKDVMFPSFQLLPEPAIVVQDIDSESDDDTFCRSSPYMSEEAMSQLSESSSEQWEPGEIPGYNDNGIYDSLRRISSDESISIAFELCGIRNHSIHFDNGFKDQDGVHSLETVHHNPLFDLPTLDAVDPFKNQIERKHSSDPWDYTDAVPQLANEPRPPPPPPPLPPVEWWATKSNFDAVGNGQCLISDGATCPNDQAPQAAITLQAKSVSSKQSLAMDTACLAKCQDPQSNGHREANQDVNVKDINDREDLLLQIRTKSFSLRRTAPVRSPGPSAPTTNTKVAAMLEKAYAIRQACVGSDEGGGDESWSDG